MMIGCTPKSFDEVAWQKEVRASDPSLLYASHRKDGKFFNPWKPVEEKNLLDLIEWKVSRKREYKTIEETKLPEVIPSAEERIARLMEKDFIMWLGHGSFLIRLKGEFFLTDPILTDRAFIVKRKSPPAFYADSLKSIADVFTVIISHNHYDHLDRETIEALPDKSTILCPPGLKEYLNEFCGKKQVVELDWWQEYTNESGIKIVSLPRPSTGPNGPIWGRIKVCGPVT